ncbi:sarcosine oxidase subunit gamma [Parasulfitobacter algicola]|uniref:Sarcosine oxidase subunit gamma n=1 Tax=Parasulfitobacter algicola TaxID=2614809 RepID=A0ABX2IWZ4_9RHOB|nr:sarcosine oxidase subunit gamma [Sulfitobacter algicola]
MVKLVAKAPCEGLLPFSYGTVSLSEVTYDSLTSVAPFVGKSKAVADVFKAAGTPMPAVGRATGKDGQRAIWFGRGQVLLAGLTIEGLEGLAAATDQSDAWAVVRLEGENADAILARLIPLDLDKGVFKRGHTARTQVQHMMASITRTGVQTFEIIVMRSMARTLVHELEVVMKAVAARH